MPALLPKTNPPAPECSVAGGRLYALSWKSAGVALVDDEVTAASVTPNAQQRPFITSFLCQLNGLLGVLNRLFVDLLNHVSGPQPCLGRGRVGVDLGDHR